MTSAAKKTPGKAASAQRATRKKPSTAKKTATTKTTTTKKAGTTKASARKASPRAATSSTTATPRRDHDLVLYGATGFTGQLVAAYLAKNAPGNVRIALAGRSEGKLRTIRAQIGGHAAKWPLVTANSADPASLARMAAGTTALISTVGPYAKYGLPVVEACATAGTNYCDLTGEVLFMRDSIDRFDTVARANKARIVHSCGFDSIPSDLGVLALAAAARHDDPAARLLGTRFIVTGAKGGVSGGTIASGLNELDRAKGDDLAASLLADPYALSPDRPGEPSPGDTGDPRGVVHDDVTGTWLAPFIMGPINSRVVRRSNALTDFSYGRQFRYAEYVSCGKGLPGRLAATGMAVGMAVGEAALALPQVRTLAGRVLPEPGAGPGDETRAKGYFTIELHTRTTTGAPYRARVAAQGDPGYAATSLMLGTTGLTLAGDGLPRRYGVLTPAVGVGEVLITNLRVAGMIIEARKV